MAAHILVIDGDCNAARSIVQSLGAAGYRLSLAGARTDLPAFASRYVDEVVRCPAPLRDKSAFQDWFIDHQLEQQIELVIAATETATVPLHELRSDGSLRTRLALPPAAAFEISIDKERVRQLATTLDIPAPSSVFVSHAHEIDDPEIGRWLSAGAVVVKSHRSKIWRGARGYEQYVRIVQTADDLHRCADEMLALGPIQIQEWVPGRGIGVEMLVDRGEVVMCFAHERLHELPLTGGGSTYRRSVAVPEDLLSCSSRLMQALAWHGVAMMEFRVDPRSGRAWMMELNGRFWGSLPLALAAGVDFPAALVRLLLEGRRPSAAQYRPGVYARHVSRDFEWTKAIARRALSRRNDDAFVLGQPLGASLIEWARVLGGNEVWDGARSVDPGPLGCEIAHHLQMEAANQARRALRKLRRARARRRAAALAGRCAGNVLILCQGNLCRSAYAAAALAARQLPMVTGIRSGALGPGPGRQSPARFQRIAWTRGVDLSAHRSRHVTPEDLAWADLILLMDDKNASALHTLDRAATDNAHWLGALIGEGPPEIADPIDGNDELVIAVLDRIDLALDAL